MPVSHEMLNSLSVDLEPWMCFYDKVPLDKDLDRGSLVSTTTRLLNIFDECRVKATFFVLGMVYEWYPSLINNIKTKGHEIAFHTHAHRELLTDGVLQRELELSTDFINEFSVTGFRAPKMKIRRTDLAMLESYNFKYDSSIYAPFESALDMGKLKEMPVSTYPVRRRVRTFPRTFTASLRHAEIPIGSGLFAGLLGQRLLDGIIRKLNQQSQPAVMFIHPWQIAGANNLGFRGGERFLDELLRLPYRIRISEAKLRYILERHTFVTMQALLNSPIGSSEP